VAVLDAETSFVPLTIPPEALQFLETRRWSVNEIARMFGIPPHLVGDVERSTSWGSGLESQNTAFVEYTVSGWTNRIQQRVTREVVMSRGATAAFSLSHLLRGTTVERAAAYAASIGAGWLTPNEARRREDLEPLPGLDEPTPNKNLTINVNPPDNAPVIG
jgi:HK97 family phage portal protein